LASGAPPSPFGTAAGFFSTNRTRGTRVPRDPLLEFGSSTELSCVVSARSLPLSRSLCPFSEHGPLTRTMPFFELAGPPLLGFFLPRTPLRRVPLFRRPGLATVPPRRGSPVPRRCRPQGSCPSRRFRLRSRRLHGSLAEPAASPWRPDASRPYSMPLASLWRCPPELSLPEEPYPLSRASLLPCGFAFDCRQRDDTGIFATAFPVESALCLRPPESERRRMNRDDGCLATARSAAWTHP